MENSSTKTLKKFKQHQTNHPTKLSRNGDSPLYFLFLGSFLFFVTRQRKKGTKRLLLVLLTPILLSAEIDIRIENSNFTINQENTTYNYNRLRLQSNYNHESFFGTFIGDGINYYGNEFVNADTFSFIQSQKSDTPFKTQTNFKNYGNGEVYGKVYRLYGGWEDDTNRIVLGLQNINMGVGRIWTPTNIFNPKNSYALEPDETFGVTALSYTRHLDELSQITLVRSQKEDNSLKSALQYKTFLEVADLALNLIHSDETKMLGYELEGNLADTGIEVRSEGAYIETQLQNQKEQQFFQAIVGADYGFENGITLVGEALYSNEIFDYPSIVQNINADTLSNLHQNHFYLAGNISYAFNLLFDTSLLYVESFGNKNSRLIAPQLTYTLNDYNSFTVGALVNSGNKESEFGRVGDLYYLRYLLSF